MNVSSDDAINRLHQCLAWLGIHSLNLASEKAPGPSILRGVNATKYCACSHLACKARSCRASSGIACSGEVDGNEKVRFPRHFASIVRVNPGHARTPPLAYRHVWVLQWAADCPISQGAHRRPQNKRAMSIFILKFLVQPPFNNWRASVTRSAVQVQRPYEYALPRWERYPVMASPAWKACFPG